MRSGDEYKTSLVKNDDLSNCSSEEEADGNFDMTNMLNSGEADRSGEINWT